MSAPYSHAAFVQQLDTVFRLPTVGGPLPLELIDVSAQRANGPFDTFSIVLRGPAGQYIPQANYRFEHDALGDIDLFIVPIRQDQHGLYYEAAFNLLRAEVTA